MVQVCCKARDSAFYLLLLLIAVALSACTNVAIHPGIPDYMSTLAIPVLQNRTSQFNLENELTQQLVKDFSVDGRLELTEPDQADAILLGTVTLYQLEPMLMDVHNVPQQYRMRIVLYLALKDTAAGKNLWVEEDFEEHATYFVANNLGMVPTNEQDARKRLIQRLSRRVLDRVIEGFAHGDSSGSAHGKSGHHHRQKTQSSTPPF